MQFIDTHKNLYLELHRDFSKIEYAPQSEASLQNFQTLLNLEIGLLMGCDIDWGTAHTEGAAGGSGDAAVLPASGNDDGDISEDSDAADARSVAAAAASRRRRSSGRRR